MVINWKMTKEMRPKQSRGVWKLQKPQSEWNESLGQGPPEALAGSIAGQGDGGKGLSRLVGSSVWQWGLFRLKHFPQHRGKTLVCQALKTTPEGICYGEGSSMQRPASMVFSNNFLYAMVALWARQKVNVFWAQSS